VVAGLFRDPSDTQSSSTCRPAPQHKRLTAFLPATLPDLPDEMTRGVTIAMSWAAHEIELRRKPNQILIRLMDGQHSLWSEADAAISDHDGSSRTALNVPACDGQSKVLKPCSTSGLSKHQAFGTNFSGLIME
jgi:hypothetical protein